MTKTLITFFRLAYLRYFELFIFIRFHTNNIYFIELSYLDDFNKNFFSNQVKYRVINQVVIYFQESI